MPEGSRDLGGVWRWVCAPEGGLEGALASGPPTCPWHAEPEQPAVPEVGGGRGCLAPGRTRRSGWPTDTGRDRVLAWLLLLLSMWHHVPPEPAPGHGLPAACLLARVRPTHVSMRPRQEKHTHTGRFLPRPPLVEVVQRDRPRVTLHPVRFKDGQPRVVQALLPQTLLSRCGHPAGAGLPPCGQRSIGPLHPSLHPAPHLCLL